MNLTEVLLSVIILLLIIGYIGLESILWPVGILIGIGLIVYMGIKIDDRDRARKARRSGHNDK